MEYSVWWSRTDQFLPTDLDPKEPILCDVMQGMHKQII